MRRTNLQLIALIIFITCAFAGALWIMPTNPVIGPTALKHGTQTIEVITETVSKPRDLARGLMYRTQLQPSHGMLFDFGKTQPIQMWMKNTSIPLDMLFFNEDGKVVHIVTYTTPFSEEVIEAPMPGRAVLELNAGFVKKHNIQKGDVLEHAIFGFRPSQN